MSKLIMLLNGESVRSDTIKSIRIGEFVPISEYNKQEIKDRVFIDHDINNVSMIEFDNIEQCKTYVSELTELINKDIE